MTHRSQRLIWFSDTSAGASRRSRRLPIVMAMCLLRAFPATALRYRSRDVWTILFALLPHQPTSELNWRKLFSLILVLQFIFWAFFENIWKSQSFCVLRRSFNLANRYIATQMQGVLFPTIETRQCCCTPHGQNWHIANAFLRVCPLAGSTVVLNKVLGFSRWFSSNLEKWSRCSCCVFVPWAIYSK